MTSEPDHLFAYVASIGEISNLLGQPRRINLYQLSITTQQLSYSLLQPCPVSVHQTGGCALYSGNQGIYPVDTFRHLPKERLSLLRAHAFEFVEPLGQCLFYPGHDLVAQRISSGLQSTRQSCEHVNVQLACDTKLLLHFPQRIDVDGDQCLENDYSRSLNRRTLKSARRLPLPVHIPSLIS